MVVSLLGGCTTGVGDIFKGKNNYSTTVAANSTAIGKAKDERIAALENQLATKAAIGAVQGGWLVIASEHLEAGHVDPAKNALGMAAKLHPYPVALDTLAKLRTDSPETALKHVQTLKRADTKAAERVISSNVAYAGTLEGARNSENAAALASIGQLLDEQQKEKQKVVYALYALAALTVAGAVFSPLFKPQLVTLAAVFFLAALVLPYLTGWVVFLIASLVAACVGVWLYRQSKASEDTTGSLVSAIESFKTKNPDGWAKLKDELKEYTTSYTPDGKQPDSRILAKIGQIRRQKELE